MIDNGIVRGSAEQAVPLIIGVTTVYVHKDICEVEVEVFGGETHTEWEYHEYTYDKDEYIKLISERVEAITPYKVTKTAYIGDTSVTFTDTPNGNLTVYFPYEYTVERMADRITVSFEELEEVTNVTISIL